jgi:hypothetical protein
MLTRRAFSGAAIGIASVGVANAATAPDVVLPLHYDYGLLWTPVLIEGKGPYRFFLHTGQTFFNISRTLATTLGLHRRSASNLEAYTPSGKLDLEIYAAKEFLLGSAYRLKNIEFVARAYDTEDLFPGTVPFFPGVPTSFDFSKNEMTFHQAGFDQPAGASALKLLPPPDGAISTVPVIQAELDGKPLKLVVNTGAYYPLTLYPSTVRRLDLWDRYGAAVSSVEIAQETGRSENRTVRAGVLRVAGIGFDKPVVHLEDPRRAVPRQFVDADGSIGMDMLRRFSIAFDHRRSLAWFTARPETLNEPFAYDRSGFDSREVGDGSREVTSVTPGGPAAKAGMQIKDRLPLTPEASVHLWYALTLPAGTKVGLEVQRDGKPVPIHLTLEELI